MGHFKSFTSIRLQFRKEEDAEKAVKDLNNRWFGGRPIYAELSPVTDFREACCRQYEMGECTRSGFWDEPQNAVETLIYPCIICLP